MDELAAKASEARREAWISSWVKHNQGLDMETSPGFRKRTLELDELRQRASVAAQAAAQAEQTLRQRWREEGRDSAELTKLVRRADYAETVLALFSYAGEREDDYRAAVDTQKALADDLRAFWLTSGHDQTELRRFLSDVDVRATMMVAK